MCFLLLTILGYVAVYTHANVQPHDLKNNYSKERDARVYNMHHKRNILLTGIYDAHSSNLPLRHRTPRRAASFSTFSNFLLGTTRDLYTPLIHTTSITVDQYRKESHFLRMNNSPIIEVVTYGADPTGVNDSTHAFTAAIAEALSRHSSNSSLADGIVDLGGTTLDLGGGDYLLSKPLVIPAGYGNVRIISGTLRASSSFPPSTYLIEIGGKVCKNRQKSCNENIAIQDIMLDGKQRAGGGIRINYTMGAVLGPDIFYLGFTHAGVTVQSGHEVMISESWFGQFLYDDSRKMNATATAIELFGNDHYVVDVVVFSSRIGLITTGGANVIEGLHTWNLATQRGGLGIVVQSPSTRLISVYLDYNALVLRNPNHVSVSDSFFLGAGNIVLEAHGSSAKINGLSIINSQFNNYNMPENDTIVIDERDGQFINMTQVTIEDMMVNGMYSRTTRATLSKVLVGKTVEFDFSNVLVLPKLGFPEQSVQLRSVISGNSFARFAVRPPVESKIRVDADESCNATLTLTVDQSRDY